MCTSVDPRDIISTGTNRPSEQARNPLTVGPTDVPLGEGLAGQARNAILTRRDRLRIAEES